MSNYTKLTAFDTKDALSTGDPLKRVKGTELDDEFDAISTAIATKVNAVAADIVTALGTTPVTNSTNAANLVTTNYSIVESGGKLLIKYGSTTIASIDSSGAFVAKDDITAYGTP